eukprot:scaffold9114_cov118-Isochrysis_galbana.AAC.5
MWLRGGAPQSGAGKSRLTGMLAGESTIWRWRVGSGRLRLRGQWAGWLTHRKIEVGPPLVVFGLAQLRFVHAEVAGHPPRPHLGTLLLVLRGARRCRGNSANPPAPQPILRGMRL